MANKVKAAKKAMDQAYEKLQRLRNEVRQQEGKLTSTAQRYRAAAASEVHEILRGLSWERKTGMNSRGKMVAFVPKEHPLVGILGAAKGLSLMSHSYNGVHVIYGPADWKHSGMTAITTDKAALERIGVKFKQRRKSKPKDRELLNALDEANISPAELKELLRNRE